MGVICAALAAGMGIPATYFGGAVLSGSYFGDRCSPMSTSALLVSSLTGTDIYRNLGGMVKTSLVPFFVSVALYALLGLGLHGSYDVSQMQALFSGTFKLTPPVLLPAAVIVLHPAQGTVRGEFLIIKNEPSQAHFLYLYAIIYAFMLPSALNSGSFAR